METGWVASAAVCRTGRASASVNAYPVDGSSRDLANTTPTTSPVGERSGPPLLPGSTRA